MRHSHGHPLALMVALLACVLGALAGASAAAAQQPWWRLDVTAAPSSLPASGEAQIVYTATNMGAEEIDATGEHPVTISEQLPEGAKPVALAAEATNVPSNPERAENLAGTCKLASTVTCEFKKTLPPYEQLVMRITVQMEQPQPTPASLRTVAEVKGGNAPAATFEKQLKTGASTSFGVESYELTPEDEPAENEGRILDTQAGSHPYQLTTTLDFNQVLGSDPNVPGKVPSAPALPDDLHIKLPRGLVGATSAVAQCSDADFATNAGSSTNLCPGDSAIGVASVVANIPVPLGYSFITVPVFNLEPAPGEPARFGFDVKNVIVVVRTRIPTGGEYGVEAIVENASQAGQVLSSQITIWGTPGDARHNAARGWECLGAGLYELSQEPPLPCPQTSEPNPSAYLTLPTSCSEPLISTVGGDSWPTGNGQPGLIAPEGPNSTSIQPALSGCGSLGFDPSIAITPDEQAASTPTGLAAQVQMPQPGLLSETGRSESAVKDTTVTLPEGMGLNPSAANGLQVCPAIAFGFEGTPETSQTENLAFTSAQPACPQASKLGTVTIQTPLLSGTLSGSLYLAEQNADPFKAPLAIYLVAEDPADGILVKLAGTVTPQPDGQVMTTFENTPQLPFSELQLHFYGGQRAALSTPARCGSYQAASAFTGWSGQTAAPASQPAFQITSGTGGGPCPGATLPFNPSFQAGAANSQAGAFTPFTVVVGHADSDQPIERLDVHLPAGIAAVLADVTPCPESAALAQACPPESLVGHATATAGLGAEPVTLASQVFLTGPLTASSGHPAGPFGLLVLTRAKTGPFDLGWVPVLSAIQIDPNNAAVSVISEPIPKNLDGVPVDLKRLEVTVERPGNQPFEFNPTSCNPSSVTATLTGYEGASITPPYPFQVGGCQNLPFHPTLTASAAGQGSKANGTSFNVTVTSGGLGAGGAAQSGIAKVDLQLPTALSSRLPTLQKACLAATFEANPTGCPEGSVIGQATIHTPILKNPLSGPAYLVSHGNEAFPDVEFVLQGEGITLILDGHTNIKNGITYSRFESTPDAPFTSFETTLPAGPHGVLTPNVPESEHFSLCKTKLQMPTEITAQNGTVINQTTNVTVTGCKGVLAAKTKLTPAQALAKALAKCRSTYKHNKHKRQACEAKARVAYTTKALAACRNANPHNPHKRKNCEHDARVALNPTREHR